MMSATSEDMAVARQPVANARSWAACRTWPGRILAGQSSLVFGAALSGRDEAVDTRCFSVPSDFQDDARVSAARAARSRPGVAFQRPSRRSAARRGCGRRAATGSLPAPVFLLACPSPPRSKPAGIQAARKLRNHRREQRWAQKTYNKSHSITAMKANPFGGASMAKGIVLEKM